MRVAVLNAGEGSDYLFGLIAGLAAQSDLELEVVDSDATRGWFDRFPNVVHFPLRRSRQPEEHPLAKAWGIFLYYLRLLSFALRSRASVFHIQWDNSFFLFDRTLLLAFYRMLGKKLVYTAHNVYKEERDGTGSRLRFAALRHCYRSVDAVVVHTSAMQQEICSRFGVHARNVHVIAHGINARVSVQGMAQAAARAALDLPREAKVVLFFGFIDRYKGVDLLVNAFAELTEKDASYRLIIAGQPKRGEASVRSVRDELRRLGLMHRVRLDARFIENEEVETYFAAADCLALPYTKIYQSGVIFLSYRFGLPIVATDTGSFRQDIVDARAGIVASERTPTGFADAILELFAGDLYREAESTRMRIRAMAEERYSWTAIGAKTRALYDALVHLPER